MHAQLCSGATDLHSGLNFQLYLYFVYTRSKCSDKTVCMNRIVWAFADRIYNKYRNLMNLQILVRIKGFTKKKELCTNMGAHACLLGQIRLPDVTVTLCLLGNCWVFLHASLSSADFFKITFLKKIISGTPPDINLSRLSADDR